MKIQNGSDFENEVVGEGAMPNHIQNGVTEGNPQYVAETSSPGTLNIQEAPAAMYREAPDAPEIQPAWAYSTTKYNEKKYGKGDPFAGKGPM